MWVDVKGAVMTAQEKNKILELKRNGASVPQVAKEFNISISNAKKVIYGVKPDEVYCIYCGKPAKRSPRGTKFCCDKCKRQYYKEHPGYVKKIKMRSAICECCHKEFTFYGRSHRTYCSKSCAKKHYFIKRNRSLS